MGVCFCCFIIRTPNQANAELWEDEIQKDQYWQVDEHFSTVGEYFTSWVLSTCCIWITHISRHELILCLLSLFSLLVKKELIQFLWFIDLWIPHLHGHHSGYWEHHLGAKSWEKLLGIPALGWTAKQCCLIWIPHFLVLHHHPQHRCSHLSLC